MKIEVCLDNIDSIEVVAQYPRVDRLELCSALGLDGLSPSAALVTYAKEKSPAQRHVMIRPRAGDFVYNDLEIQMMLDEIDIYKKIGIDGIVFGCLDKSGGLAYKQVQLICEKAKSYQLQTTFHRAIDMSHDFDGSVKDCVKLGITRILTSGGQKTALQGIKRLRQVNARYKGDIEIMAGSGVNGDNVQQIITSGVDAVHFSASKSMSKTYVDGVFDQASLSYRVTDPIKLESLINLIDE